MYNHLLTKIKDKSARVGVIGLGYVGLPLATGLAKSGYYVTGLDASQAKVDALNGGSSYIPDVPSADVAALIAANLLTATTDYNALHEIDVVFICVPTPFDSMKAPDLTYVRQAATGIAPRLHHGQLIVLQSTTYPGTTEEVVQPILEATGLTAGEDFFLAFSPERIDPGRADFTVENTPKVVGGINPQSATLTGELLAYLTPHIHVVSSPRAAEMTKLLENIFRSVNIALVNELAVLSERMGIDFWEVIEAAKTKPFGFMPFYPSPGVGGHCIPVDPYYLSWKAREYDFYTRFIELAAEVNGDMPYHTVELIGRVLNQAGKTLRNASVLILGVAFKPNIDDARNSPAERVIELLIREGAKVSYHDPYVPHFRVGGDIVLKDKLAFTNIPLTTTTLSQADCTVIVTGHRDIDYKWVVNESALVVDTVNATRHIVENRHKIVRLGAPLELKRE
ncbi:MAG: UDP-N-acetyl-D-glucosamine dehydrogenase [Chloroflexota bacterium]|nr:MAG: UDP-N-acetyl-D-glucosamine dehydrogenase [Chloroflexota bacterium]